METSLVLRPVSTLPWTTTTCSQGPGLGRSFVTSQYRAKRSLISGAWRLTGTPTKTQRVIKHCKNIVRIATRCFVRELQV